MNSKVKQPKKKRTNYFLYDFVKITGAIPALIWMRPKVIYLGSQEKRQNVKGGVLISANHNSFTDPILIHCAFWKRRLHCLATKDLYTTKLKSFFFRHMKCIQVDKENFSMDSFHRVVDDLKEGKAVVIFPEGQVNTDNKQMLAFKSGASLMAYQANVPVLPVYLVKNEKKLSRRVVLVGDPVYVRAESGERPSIKDLNRISDVLRQRELELVEKYNQKYGKEKKHD